ncbi:MAG: Calx-beta domain-containing protein [Lysobacterales bacterium]
MRFLLIVVLFFPVLTGAQTVTVDTSTASASENGQVMAVVRFSRTGSTASPLQVNVTKTGNTTVTGADYADNTGSFFEQFNRLTIPAGESFFDLQITPSLDNLVEPQEILGIALAAGAYTIGPENTATVTIDDDPPVVSLEAVNLSAAEGGAQANININRSGGNINAVLRVNFTFDPANTASGSDYSDNNGSFFEQFARIDIPVGQSSFGLELTATPDILVEGEETLAFSLASGSYVNGPVSELTVTIADDAPVVSLQPISLSAAEGGAVASVNINRTGGNINAALRVHFTFDVANTASGNDYSDNNGGFFEQFARVDIPTGQSTFALELTATADNDVEGEELLTFSLASGDYQTGPTAEVTVAIADDAPVVTLTPINLLTAEGGDAAVVRFSRQGGTSTAALRANVVIEASSTAVSADYSDNNGGFFESFQRVTIAAGEPFFDLEISADQDGLDEGDEVLDFSLAAGSYLLGAQTSVSITLLDSLIFSDGFETTSNNKTCEVDHKAKGYLSTGDTLIDLRTGLIWRTCTANADFSSTSGHCESVSSAGDTTMANVATVFNSGNAGSNDGHEWRLASRRELASVGLVSDQCLVR